MPREELGLSSRTAALCRSCCFQTQLGVVTPSACQLHVLRCSESQARKMAPRNSKRAEFQRSWKCRFVKHTDSDFISDFVSAAKSSA